MQISHRILSALPLVCSLYIDAVLCCTSSNRGIIYLEFYIVWGNYTEVHTNWPKYTEGHCEVFSSDKFSFYCVTKNPSFSPRPHDQTTCLHCNLLLSCHICLASLFFSLQSICSVVAKMIFLSCPFNLTISSFRNSPGSCLCCAANSKLVFLFKAFVFFKPLLFHSTASSTTSLSSSFFSHLYLCSYLSGKTCLLFYLPVLRSLMMNSFFSRKLI